MARKADDITEFLLKDIKKQEDILEITSYLEEAEYRLEDMQEILYSILLQFIENRKVNRKRQQRYLN